MVLAVAWRRKSADLPKATLKSPVPHLAVKEKFLSKATATTWLKKKKLRGRKKPLAF